MHAKKFMASLAAVQQFIFESYLALSQRPPIGKVDISKLRRLVQEIQITHSNFPPFNPEVIEEVFERCVTIGTRRLEFPPFEKAVIMLSMIYFPKLNAADSYMTFAVKVLSKLPSMTSLGFPSTNLAGLATIADIMLEEKVHACSFHSVFVSELGKTPLCDPCLESVIGDSRLYRRKRVDVASSPFPPSVVLAPSQSTVLVSGPPVSSEDIVQPPVVSPAVYVHGATHPPLFPSVSPLPFRPPKKTYVGFPPRSRKTSESSEASGDQVFEKDLQKDKKTQLELFQDLYVFASDLEAMLIENFGCLEYAFDYMDSSRGARRGQISKTTFKYCLDQFKLSEPSGLFSFLDIKADGVLDLEELAEWRSVRTAHIKRLET